MQLTIVIAALLFLAISCTGCLVIAFQMVKSARVQNERDLRMEEKLLEAYREQGFYVSQVAYAAVTNPRFNAKPLPPPASANEALGFFDDDPREKAPSAGMPSEGPGQDLLQRYMPGGDPGNSIPTYDFAASGNPNTPGVGGFRN